MIVQRRMLLNSSQVILCPVLNESFVVNVSVNLACVGVLVVPENVCPKRQYMKKATAEELFKLRAVASYQLGRGTGATLFTKETMVVRSSRTGRMRYLYRDGKLVATLRPTDGMLALSLAAAQMLMRDRCFKNVVTVQTDVSDFIKRGRNVFAKHVVRASSTIRPEDEVIVVNERNELLATGRAFLSGEEMLSFRRGVAVKVRHGSSESQMQTSSLKA